MKLKGSDICHENQNRWTFINTISCKWYNFVRGTACLFVTYFLYIINDTSNLLINLKKVVIHFLTVLFEPPLLAQTLPCTSHALYRVTGHQYSFAHIKYIFHHKVRAASSPANHSSGQFGFFPYLWRDGESSTESDKCC